jgi:hypothetical protein
MNVKHPLGSPVQGQKNKDGHAKRRKKERKKQHFFGHLFVLFLANMYIPKSHFG